MQVEEEVLESRMIGLGLTSGERITIAKDDIVSIQDGFVFITHKPFPDDTYCHSVLVVMDKIERFFYVGPKEDYTEHWTVDDSE